MGRKFMLPLVVVSFLLSTYSFGFGADVIKLKFANYFPPMHMNSVVMGQFCKELNAKLAGKVELTQYAGGTLLTAPKMAAGVATGLADIGLSNCSYTRGRFPVMEIMELPLGFPSPWVATHVANEFYNKFKPKEWDAYHPLMFSTSPPNGLLTISKQVNTLEELKRLRTRSQGRIADIVKALGGTPMSIEIVDLYEALRRGVIDGAYTPLETLKGFRLGEVSKFMTESWSVGSVFAFYVVMNKQKWNSLPPDIQNAISEFSNGFIERWAAEWNRIDIEGLDFFEKQGGKMISVTNAESARWVKAVEPVVEDFKKDLVAKGYKADEVDGWISFVKERITYWKGQEKARKIPTAYKY